VLHLALRSSGADPGFLHIDKVQMWREWQDRHGATLRTDPERLIALLGDSVITGRGPLGSKNLPTYLDEVAKRSDPRHPREFGLLGWPGQSLYERYFLADELASSGVRTVVFPFNLGSASTLFRATTSTELSGWMPVSRWPEAASLPLAEIGLGIDHVALYGAGRALGALRPWRALRRDQSRMAGLAELVQARLLTDPAARQRMVDASTREYHDQITARNYGPAFRGLGRDSPAIRMLEATLRIYRSAGLRVLVFVDPIDQQTLGELGFASDSPGLARTLASLAAVTVETGGSYVDLHDALSHEDFFDSMGHLTWAGERNGTQRLADVVAPHIFRLIAQGP
jgi:hypothetical protein